MGGVGGKIAFVDLAGSERNKKTGTVGARFKESVTIKASPMNQLKEELKEKPKLNHVDTVDKSAPMIESSTKIAKDARPQLMSELLTKSSSHGIAAS